MKKLERTYRYTRLFREEVLREIHRENMTVCEASKYYGVALNSIYRWMKQAGIPNPQKEVYYVSISKKNEILKKYEALQKENQALKDALSKLTLDKLCLEKVIEIAERDYKVDFKKKSGTQVLKKSEK